MDLNFASAGKSMSMSVSVSMSVSKIEAEESISILLASCVMWSAALDSSIFFLF